MAKGMRPRGIGNRAGADAAGLRLHPEPRSKAEGLGSGCLLLEHYLSLIILHVPLKFSII